MNIKPFSLENKRELIFSDLKKENFFRWNELSWWIKREKDPKKPHGDLDTWWKRIFSPLEISDNEHLIKISLLLFRFMSFSIWNFFFFSRFFLPFWIGRRKILSRFVKEKLFLDHMTLRFVEKKMARYYLRIMNEREPS